MLVWWAHAELLGIFFFSLVQTVFAVPCCHLLCIFTHANARFHFQKLCFPFNVNKSPTEVQNLILFNLWETNRRQTKKRFFSANKILFWSFFDGEKNTTSIVNICVTSWSDGGDHGGGGERVWSYCGRPPPSPVWHQPPSMHAVRLLAPSGFFYSTF